MTQKLNVEDLFVVSFSRLMREDQPACCGMVTVESLEIGPNVFEQVLRKVFVDNDIELLSPMEATVTLMAPLALSVSTLLELIAVEIKAAIEIFEPHAVEAETD